MADDRPRVLIVSKPLVPPWTDGSKNLARDLVAHVDTVDFVHAAGPGAGWQARALARLSMPDRTSIAHFFFAPNPRTNRVAATLRRLRPGRKVVHTVCSKPADGVTTWFADVHVALTETTALALREAGAPDVRLIRPGVPATAPAPPSKTPGHGHGHGPRPTTPQGDRILFAGDLRPGGGADLAADALERLEGVHGVFACRPKGPGHADTKARLEARLGDRATWLGVVDDMPALFASCDAQWLPATDLTAKVDVPLVVLEGLRDGLPCLLADAAPLSELQGPGVVHAAPDPDAVAAAMTVLLDARPVASLPSEYSAATMARRYEALYSELL